MPMLKAERISCSGPKLSDAQTRNFEAIKHSKLARHLARQAGGRVKSEGKGWEYPLTASLGGFRADVRYEAAGAPLGW